MFRVNISSKHLYYVNDLLICVEIVLAEERKLILENEYEIFEIQNKSLNINWKSSYIYRLFLFPSSMAFMASVFKSSKSGKRTNKEHTYMQYFN